MHPPAPHPHDRALLRPLSTLGKPKFSDSGVSFLRRTEYISSYTSKSRFDSTTSRTLIDNTGSRVKRPAPQNLDRESPEYIKSQVEKSFQIAAQNLKDRNRVRHPTKRNLKLINAYPLLPDHESFPDAGGYFTIKFLTNPVPPSSTYDIRLESGLVKPIPDDDDEIAAKTIARELHEKDPTRYPAPNDAMNYEFYLPENPSDALNFKRKFDTLDPEKDDETLYTNKNSIGESNFRFKRIRGYESASQVGTKADKYDEEVIIALHDGKNGRHQKAAYYYPLVQRLSIRPQRARNIFNSQIGSAIPGKAMAAPDFIDVVVEDPSEDVKADMDRYKNDPTWLDQEEEMEDGQDGQDGQQNGNSRGVTPVQPPKAEDVEDGNDVIPSTELS